MLKTVDTEQTDIQRGQIYSASGNMFFCPCFRQSRHQISVRLAPDAEELLSLCDLSVENMLEILIRVGGLSTISEMFNMTKNRLEFKVRNCFRGTHVL